MNFFLLYFASRTDNERQGVFADAQVGRHPADDDRADEFPKRGLDHDRGHVHPRHAHLLRGDGA